MKKSLILSCILGIAAMGISSCASSKVEETTAPERPVIIGMANPFQDCQTLEEAASITGFSIELPTKEQLPEWADKIIYRASVVNTKLLEIIYPGDENFTKEIRIRKALATDKEDISGDYNSYEKEEKIELGGKSVIAKSNQDKIFVVIWNQEDYSYSLRVSQGLNKSEIIALMNEIK